MPGPSRIDHAVLAPDPARRRIVVQLLEAALRAVDPEEGVAAVLAREGNLLTLAGAAPVEVRGRAVTVLGLGKAVAPMARGALALLTDAQVTGVLAGPPPARRVGPLPLVAGGHPIPTQGSVEAGRRLLAAAAAVPPGEFALVLVSGGGSALAMAPAAGLTLDDLVATGDALLRSGAPIEDVNTVRKHLSAVAGGRLAEALAPATAWTLVVSDVVGSPLEAIASGPTVPDPTSYGDALGVLERYGITGAVPGAVTAHLRRGVAGEVAETPKVPPPGLVQSIEVIADGTAAAAAAATAGRAAGLSPQVVTAELTGEARDVAATVVADLRARPAGAVLVYAGETTVTVTGRGRGGRNQELGLAAAIAIDGDPDIVVAALGTDGVDGPTEAAGAIVDGRTATRARRRGLDPAAHLVRNDAHPLLDATGDLIRTGPTGTNVGDVVVAWRR